MKVTRIRVELEPFRMGMDWYQVRLYIVADGNSYHCTEDVPKDDLISNYDKYMDMVRDRIRQDMLADEE